MSADQALYLVQQGLLTAMFLAGPLLITALVVGTIVSVLQAVTQVQEVTLVFVPKMLATFAVMAVAGGWMIQVMTSFGVEMFQSIAAP
jgi:flagellar biosynthetic protein FliQ